MKKIKIEAKFENLVIAQNFITDALNDVNCNKKVIIRFKIFIEEIFMNIVNYSFENGDGEVTLCFDSNLDLNQIEIEFVDTGKPFNPLEQDSTNLNETADERVEGGLGILIAKNIVDHIEYVNQEGENILTIRHSIV